MDKQTAIDLMQKYVPNANLQKHCIATGIVMEFLAKALNEDEEKWMITGLLHDIDYVETADKPMEHSLLGAERLKELGFPEDVVYAVKVHNEMHNLPRLSLLDKALYASDPLTGLIVAGALIKPEKKLASIDVDFLVKRFHEKSFAKGANREQISSCTELGSSLEDFMDLALRAMQSISKELGL